jgi:hypothetical protein
MSCDARRSAGVCSERPMMMLLLPLPDLLSKLQQQEQHRAS